MSKHIRHAAELASRLTTVAHRRFEKRRELKLSVDDLAPIANAVKVAQDVDKLMRRARSLNGIAGKGARECGICDGRGTIPVPGDEPPEVSFYHCVECGGTGNTRDRAIVRREWGLTQAITDTLKPYGLTWQHETEGGAVRIHFADAVHANGKGWEV
jgi:hypothetical protein